MADPFTVVYVSSEDEAWEVLQTAIDSGLSPDKIPLVQFKNWPSVTVELPHTQIEGSISPSMMEAFIELQKTIYRAHTFVTSDTGDLRSLSRVEKGNLEFRLKVEKGSSHYEVDLTQIIEKLGAEAINKMTPTHIVVSVLGIALIVASTVVLKSWLNTRTNIRLREIDDAEKRAWLENQKYSLEQDTKRLEVLAKALSREPILQEVEAAADGARHQLVKAISEEQGGVISGVNLNPEAGFEIVSSRRQQAQDIRLDGVYRVTKVDTTVPDGFRVTLSDIATGQEVTASMLDVLISEEQRQIVKDAEWNKTIIHVEMTGRRLRNRVVDAVIQRVSPAI